MIRFECPKCGEKYDEADNSAGKRFFCLNMACGTRLEVPRTSPTRVAVAAAAPTDTWPAAASDKPAAASDRPSSGAGEWLYVKNGAQAGPVTRKDLKQLASAGTVAPNTLVWTEGMAEWKPAETALPDLFAPPPKPRAKPVAPKSRIDADDSDEASTSPWEKIGIAFFAVVAAGILVALGWALIPKLRSQKTEDVAAKHDEPAKSEPAAPQPVRVVASAPTVPAPPVRVPTPTPTPEATPAPAPAPKQAPPPPVVTPQPAPPVAKQDDSRKLSPAEVNKRAGPSVAIIKGKDGHGSGFLIGPGIVVTNSHVVKDEIIGNIEVLFPDAEGRPTFKAELLYEHCVRDLAVLKVIDCKLPPLALFEGECLKGEEIVVIGSPGQTENTVTPGFLNLLNYKLSDKQDYFQTSATVHPGNSGGPVLNSHAEVIAVVVAYALEGDGKGQAKRREGTNLAVPLADLRKAVKKGSERSAAEASRAQGLHDGSSMATRLASASAMYVGTLTAFSLAAAEAQRNKKSPAQVVDLLTKAAAPKIKEAHKRVVGDYLPMLSTILANSALDKKVRDRIEGLKALHADAKDMFDTPKFTNLGDFNGRIGKLRSRFEALTKGLDDEFGAEF
jgi:S1-C subfamily serine protease